MRHLLLALMIALLPLRGWAGDVMAVRMAAPALSASQPADHPAPAEPAAAMHADCADHEAVADHADGQSHCGNCTACETCHTVALPAPALRIAPPVLVASPPLSPYSHLASAERAPGFKPPIS